MSNRRKLRKPKGDLATRQAIKIARRSRQQFAIRRKAIAAKVPDLTDPNSCHCGRKVPKLYKKEGYCCVACNRGDGHTPSCNKREASA